MKKIILFIKRKWWLVIALLSGLIYIILKIIKNSKETKLLKFIDNINIIAENKLARLYWEEENLKKEKKKNEEVIKSLSRNQLIDDIRKHL